jgi:DNA repair protein RadC
VIAAEELFRGTLTQTSVYPREVVKHALRTTRRP